MNFFSVYAFLVTVIFVILPSLTSWSLDSIVRSESDSMIKEETAIVLGGESFYFSGLLHVFGRIPQIPDANFLLSDSQQPSTKTFDWHLEKQATVAEFKRHPESICRFPARWLLLSAQYPDLKRTIKEPSCPEYQEFLQKVPGDSMFVIFASENLINPMSMLGHGMLSLEGVRISGNKVQHSVSFYVELSSHHPVSMVTETLVDGKDGVFQVTPLRHYYKNYSEKEQRNVWRYQLRLSDIEKRLLQAHIWELKTVKIPYYFHTHNCATLSLDVLRAIKPELARTAWVTPRDLVKSVYHAGLINSVEIVPSHKWRYKALSDIAPETVRSNVKAWILEEQPDLKPQPQAQLDHIQTQLAKAALKVDYQQNQRTPASYSAAMTSLTANKLSHSRGNNKQDFIIDWLDYKAPFNTPGDAHWQLGYMQQLENDWWVLNWLPIGKGVEDNNHHYFGESELKLLDVSLKYDPKRKLLRLQELQLYSTKAIHPTDGFTQDISGYLNFGFKPYVDEQHQEWLTAHTAVGLGLATYWVDDVTLYALLGVGGYGHHELGVWGYLAPELGALVSWRRQMKSHIHVRQQLGWHSRVFYEFTWAQSWFLTRDQSLLFESSYNSIGKGFWSHALHWRWYY